ncbi:MAG: glyoxylate/hydroxypyruvate reductase A [Acidobacteria bacterium]|nr:glyoxylate/hydroxypyruvate reductase A [Acidobacteriota bacterium]MDA1233466.1 glyoxylate/hydroxypyruvate reductase A [Acidobacteriota bacterium]
MSLLLVINGAGQNWAPESWLHRFSERLSGRRIVIANEQDAVVEVFRYAAVWKPTHGFLARCKGLEVIFNLGAGVDALLQDRTLPNVPLVRIVNQDLRKRMTEYVVLHCLMHHRRQRALDDAQARCVWEADEQPAAAAVRVGILGLGELGQDAAEVLHRIGFQVAGWSRARKTVPGIRSYAGQGELNEFLGRTDILVALVPLTPDTQGILNRDLFQRLARDGALGSPVLINAGRGGLQVEADIISCLNDGTLGAATLDVFHEEPLGASTPFWGHPKVTVTPHNAADSDPEAISDDIAAQILDYEAGKPLRNVVDRNKGY